MLIINIEPQPVAAKQFKQIYSSASDSVSLLFLPFHLNWITSIQELFFSLIEIKSFKKEAGKAMSASNLGGALVFIVIVIANNSTSSH